MDKSMLDAKRREFVLKFPGSEVGTIWEVGDLPAGHVSIYRRGADYVLEHHEKTDSFGRASHSLPRKLSDGWPALNDAKGWDEVLVFYPARGDDPGGWQVQAVSTIWNGLAIAPSHWLALPPAPGCPEEPLADRWTPLSPASLPPPDRPLLVTNNITSRLANGQMAMLWLVSAVHYTPPRDGSREEFYAYAREGELVRWLTHWRLAVPEEG